MLMLVYFPSIIKIQTEFNVSTKEDEKNRHTMHKRLFMGLRYRLDEISMHRYPVAFWSESSSIPIDLVWEQ